MKRSMKKTAAVALSGMMAMGLLSGCGEAKLDGTKTVATVDGTNIPMGVLSLAVRTQQASLESVYSYYKQAGYLASIWDDVVDEESNETYGEQTVSSMLDEIETMYLLRSHAADYGVELSADDEKAIAEAAAKFMEDNTEDTIKDLAVTEDQVKEYLELLTYRTRVEAAIEAEADTEVSDDEAQQSGFTYVSVPLDEETEDEADAEEEAEAEDEADAEEEAAEDEAEAEDEADTEDEAEAEDEADAEEEAAEDETEAEDEADAEEAAEDETDAEEEAAEAEDTLDGKTKAEELLKAMQEDPSADMSDVAQTIDETLIATTGTFFVNESEYSEEEGSDYPEELITALKELKDGELVSEVIVTDDGYYVARLDQVFDVDATEHEKEHIASHKQSEYYTEVTDGWKEEVKITVEEKVLAALKVTDSHTFTLKAAEAEEEEDVVEDTDPIDEELAEDAAVLDDESSEPEAVDAEQ